MSKRRNVLTNRVRKSVVSEYERLVPDAVMTDEGLATEIRLAVDLLTQYMNMASKRKMVVSFSINRPAVGMPFLGTVEISKTI